MNMATQQSKRIGRQNSDSLVGSLHRKHYCSSFDTLAKEGYISGLILMTTGLIVDALSQLGCIVLDGSIPKQWLQIAMVQQKDDKTWAVNIPEQFRRTLAGDKGPDGSSPPSWYGRACESARDKRPGQVSNWKYIDTTQLIEAGGLLSGIPMRETNTMFSLEQKPRNHDRPEHGHLSTGDAKWWFDLLVIWVQCTSCNVIGRRTISPHPRILVVWDYGRESNEKRP